MAGRPSSANTSGTSSAFAESVRPARRTSPPSRRSLSHASSTRRPAGDAREKLGNERENHARSSRMRSIRRVVRIAGLERNTRNFASQASSSPASRCAAGSELALPPITITSGTSAHEEFARRCALEFRRRSRRRRVQPEFRHARRQELSGAQGRSWRDPLPDADRARTAASLSIATTRMSPREFACSRKPDVTRVQQVETAARAHHSLPGAFPLAPVGNQLTLRNDLSQTSACRPDPERTAEELNSIMRAHRSAADALKLVATAQLLRDLCEPSRGGGREVRCYNFCLS